MYNKNYRLNRDLYRIVLLKFEKEILSFKRLFQKVE